MVYNWAKDTVYAFPVYVVGDLFDGSKVVFISTFCSLHNIFLPGNCSTSLVDCYYRFQATPCKIVDNVCSVVDPYQCDDLFLYDIDRTGFLY